VGLPVVEGGVVPEAPYVVLPRPEVVFAARAARLRALAQGHATGPWLGALAAVCDAQNAAIATPARGEALRAIVSALAPRGAALPPVGREALARIDGASTDQCASWAAWLDGGDGPEGVEPDGAVGLFVAAALQVEHTARAAAMKPGAIARVHIDCPVCRAPAAAGVVTGDTKTRYLACSRCSSAWNRMRVQCVTCASPASSLEYLTVEGTRAPGVKAEACSGCLTYVKLFYEEDRPGVEPLADDAATLALDLRMGEDGWARGAANPLIRAGWRPLAGGSLPCE
jgi:FdhE protein